MSFSPGAWRAWVAVTLATIVAGSSANAVAAEPVLTARPGVCILDKPGKSPCLMAVELSWNSNGPGNYCLYSSQAVESLACWTGATRGQQHAELASRENVSFWLQEAPSEQHLAEITIRIVSLSQRNPQRRRRRHVWNVL